MYTQSSCFLLFVAIHTICAYAPWNYNGTTPTLDNIMKGRCAEYQILDEANKMESLSVELNCTTDVWDIFTKVFADKDPCTTILTEKDYMPLFDKIQNKKLLTDKETSTTFLSQIVPFSSQKKCYFSNENSYDFCGRSLSKESMFWSGTREVVHDFTHVNSDYVTLEDTFAGYLANDLNWCGCSISPDCTIGIEYDSCNKSCSKQSNPYWDLASRSFAEKAAGIVYVLVNGTQNGTLTAYWRGTTFGKIELPTLGKKQQVKLLHILVVNDVDKEPKEKCGTGTLVQMVEDAHKHNVTNIQCTDDPRMVNSILCAKYPSANECQEKEVSSAWKDTSIAMIAVASLFLIIIVILLIILGKRRNK